MKQQISLAPTQFKRRTIFVKKSLQLRYMALILISVLVGLLIMAYELTFTLNDIFDQYPVLLQPLYDHFPALAYGFIYKVLIYIIFVVLISAILSHRMAGPIYRFEQTCKAVAKGDFSQRVHLRQGDQLTELQDEFNKMMDRVESEINKKNSGDA